MMCRAPLYPERVHRELWVRSGHPGATGRLDIVVELPGKTALVLELKRGAADAADTAKQEGYFSEMERSGMKCRYLLLVTDAAGEEVNRFTPMRYPTLCLRLRSWVAKHRDDPRGHIFLALVLAFVGAIESNLLGFRVSRERASMATLHHLTNFMEDNQ